MRLHIVWVEVCSEIAKCTSFIICSLIHIILEEMLHFGSTSWATLLRFPGCYVNLARTCIAATVCVCNSVGRVSQYQRSQMAIFFCFCRLWAISWCQVCSQVTVCLLWLSMKSQIWWTHWGQSIPSTWRRLPNSFPTSLALEEKPLGIDHLHCALWKNSFVFRMRRI